MIILFEDYPYSPQETQALEGLEPIVLQDGRIKYPYVGYYYHVATEETVFILPKVFICGKDRYAFGKYKPEDLLFASDSRSLTSKQDGAFLFELSAWLYQAINLFSKRHQDSQITALRSLAGLVDSRGGCDATLLDHVLALLHFNKEHQSLFVYMSTITHSRRRKVHWTKTVRTTQPIIREGIPHYMSYQAKCKSIDFDEELLNLFYATLSYLKDSYLFPVKKILNYNTGSSNRVQQLIATGKGTRFLRKIRSNYFVDELVALWNLLYGFYEQAEHISERKAQDEILLVRNFNIIFEDMIDCLIGDSSVPKELKNQKDGKLVDHIYRDRSLVESSDIYFIGDSKYYKEETCIGINARYKQFTYTKNVIQYNVDLFNKGKAESELRYLDPLTEGYNPTPNFLIRGVVDPNDLSYSDDKLRQDSSGRYCNYHFRNRLFDRGTLWVLTYDVNVFYVLSAYVQRGAYNKSIDNFLRGRFRDDIINTLEETYDFYEIQIKDRTCTYEKFVEQNFKKLIGKIYQNADGHLILALKKEEEESTLIYSDLSTSANLKKVAWARGGNSFEYLDPSRL